MGNQQNDDNDVKEKEKKNKKKQNVTNCCSAVGGQSGVYKNRFVFGYCGEDIIRDGPIKSLSTVRGHLSSSWDV